MVVLGESDPGVLLSAGSKVCEQCRHLGPTAIRGPAQSLPERMVDPSIPFGMVDQSCSPGYLHPWPESLSGPKDLF